MAKWELWGGPEDGLEVEVTANNLQVVVDSPSTQTSRNHMLGVNTPTPPKRKARYVFNKAEVRFEWKEYISE